MKVEIINNEAYPYIQYCKIVGFSYNNNNRKWYSMVSIFLSRRVINVIICEHPQMCPIQEPLYPTRIIWSNKRNFESTK